MTEKNISTGSLQATNDAYVRMVSEIQDYAIIMLDKDGIIRNWNKGAEKIKLYKEEDIVGKHFSIFYFPEDLAANLPLLLITEARETGRAIHEGWRKRKDGSRFWGSVTITAFHDDEGEVIGFSKVTRDLTEKKINEDNLRLSEERYHMMVAEVEDYAIILLSPEGIIENWNTGAEKIKGYAADEAIGKRFDMFYTEEDRKNGLPNRLLEQARKTGKALQEGWRVRKNGSKFWGTIVITALHAKDGTVVGFSKVTRDLTEKKLAEEQVLAYTTELENQNRELEQFAYVASHDLQEPLRKIQTFADFIQKKLDDENYVRTYLGKLENSARRMSELIKALLDYSRLSKTKDREEQPIANVNLNAVLGEIEQDFELLIQEKQAKIGREFLPTVQGDRVQLTQLFSNLLSNSLKFTTGNPVIQLSSRIVAREDVPNPQITWTAENFHCISIQDNGIGFEPQYETTIFSLFKRLHGKQDYSGTGIGLALCKKIAENHGGSIDASSSLGQGARFDVYLPAETD